MNGRTRSKTKSTTRALVLGLGSAMLYGGWALYANASSGRGLRAAAAQAALSFASTTMLTLVVEWLFALGKTPRRGFWLAASGTIAFMIAVMGGIHAAVGTPRILVTIAPSVLFGGMFFTGYAWALRVSATLPRRAR